MNFNDPYIFDVDNNGIISLTKNNVQRINFIIENDPNYRSDSDPYNENSTYNYIRNHPYTTDYKEILEIVKKIDKQNSTHQASSGINKGDNNGREKTAEFIHQIENFYERLKNGDPELVNEIANALKARYTFCFASKYCTYMSRYLLESDCYSIYDKILSDILPYFAWLYLDEIYLNNKRKSTISNTFAPKNNGDYKGYRDLIDKIRFKADKVSGYLISRKDFDHLLWYYFKGDRDIIDTEKKNMLHKSRITKALDFIDKKESKLI
jgi:hypothetical protein